MIGWDEGQGTPSSFCNGNVFMGQAPLNNSPTFAPNSIGALDGVDISFETWALKKTGGGGGTGSSTMGLNNQASGVFYFGSYVAQNLVGTSNNRTLLGYYTDGVGVNAVGPDTFPARWTHIAVNAEADVPSAGDITINMYINAEVQTPAVIDSLELEGNFSESYFYPLYGTLSALAQYDGYEDDPTTEIFPQCVGPAAVHNRLLTTSEIRSSFQNRKTQLLGASTTLAAYYWNVEFEDGWEEDIDNLLDAHHVGAPFSVRSPMGTNGTVRVRDESGNENHYLIPVAATYSTTSKPNVAFGNDPWFTRGY